MPFRFLRSLTSSYPVRFVLLAYVGAPLVLTFGLVWFLTLLQLERHSEERMQQEIELVARAMQPPLSRALDEDSPNRLRESLDSALAIDRVYGAYVYNQVGELVLAVGHEPEDRRPEIRQIVAEGDQRGEYGEVSGRRMYSYFVPLSDIGGRVTGVLQVTRRQRDFEEHFSELRWQAMGALALCTGLMVGLVLWGHHHALGKHIQRLAQDMQLVGRGKRRHRASLQGPRELRTLGTSLNTMLDSIALSEDKLKRQRQVQTALEERLHRSEKLAAIGGLAAGVAHELGTPLSIVDGHAQRLQRDATLTPSSTRAVHQVRDQVRRMERIVRQLLDFGGRRSAQQRPAKVGEIVTRVCRTLGDFAETHSVTLTTDVDRIDVIAPLDVAGLEQALGNLVRNAIQAAPGGNVLVRTQADADSYRIWVEDDGPGIPERIRGRIFEPFFTTKPVGQGTGLGLALTHRALQDMDGTIDVMASDRGGARFEIVLPRKGLPAREAC